ncbi:type 2 isopentenyl-diphosphate Delta-isomerase [Bacillus sp. FJAT-29790]|uniref:type 2 isopentenyl-diphosphate Delta-isomerase n=1 Tax=Bacillus sp. FJAT-29790 TaxID=1895002 RepID=UPI001C21CF97|nr:type 2 isopentenyl-diphosphate Delta-isomerase [Bacillus sp. FJAT-29790]
MSRSIRKWDHINLALSTGQARLAGFDDITFIHQSLPDASIDQAELITKIGELHLSSPVFINAMTGGGGERTLQINRDLAIAAKQTGVAISVGSQMSALKDPAERESYQVVRKEYPNGIVIGNIGSEATVDQAKAAIDMIEANALQIHLNVVQELTMPEGDRDFRSTLSRIEEIVRSVGVPIIVKEVGFGVNKETASMLQSIGVSAVDVGGFGGTNFARIENERRANSLAFFNEWGIPSSISIVEAKNGGSKTSIIGSGGIQTSLDMAKAIALGADAVGVAGYFLKILIEEGIKALIDEIQITHNELTIMMTALGARTIRELQQAPIIISGKTHHWLNERNIDTKRFSQRNIH